MNTASLLVGALVGPTAAGKSRLAMAWAEKTGGALLSVDAMQVYRGADVGTGKPTQDEQNRIHHGGIDLIEIGQSFSVTDYLQHAGKFLRECKSRQQPVLAVGGTGLYYRALTQGLSAAPRGSLALRQELEALSVEALQQRILAQDPEGLAGIDTKNPRRLMRAIECFETSGQPLRWWHAQPRSLALAPNLPTGRVSRSKSELDALINKRVKSMWDNGWAAEIRQLLEKHPINQPDILPAIGYYQIAQWIIRGAPSIEEKSLLEEIATATRQYAKRQLTWFRREPHLQSIFLDAKSDLHLKLPDWLASLSSVPTA